MTLGPYLCQCLCVFSCIFTYIYILFFTYYVFIFMQIIDTLFCFINLVHLLFIDLCKKKCVCLCQVAGCFYVFFIVRNRCGLVSSCHQTGNGWPWMWTIGSTSSKLKTSSSMSRAIQFPSCPVSWSESSESNPFDHRSLSHLESTFPISKR